MSSAILARSLRLSASVCPRRLASRFYASSVAEAAAAGATNPSGPATTSEAKAPRRRRSPKASADGTPIPDGSPKTPKKRGRKKDSENDDPGEEYIAGKVVLGYLDQLASAEPPAVRELERLQNAVRERDHPRFETSYVGQLEKLKRSFSVKQLQYFAEDCYGLTDLVRGKRRRNKTEWATLIMEKRWRWPELEGVLKERRDWSEQASEVHPVDAKEAFLLLGPDGSNLKSLSVRYNVHLSFSSRPMYVKAEGYKGSVDQLRESIKEFREGIIEDTFSLPIRQPVSDDLLHRISKRVGAFLQNERPGVIRITYVAGQQHTLAQAQRLLARRVCETEGTSQTSVLAYAPADINSLKPLSMFPQAYSLYPFLAQRSTLQTLNVSGAFRVRKVGDWLHVHGSEEVERTGGLSRRKGKNIGLDQDHHDIREALMQALPGDIPEGMQRKISASTGHILFTRPPAKISTLVPPLTGTWSLDSFVKWVKDNRAPHIFCSDLPSPLQTAVPRQQDQLHRLIYQAVDPESEGHFISVEALMQNTEQAEQHELEDGETAAPPNKLSVSCTSGVERQLPIMLPDRPLDIRFSVADSRNLSTEQLPKELQHYLADLNAFIFEGGDRQRPITPLIVQHEGRAYVVHSSQSVGRSVVPITHRVFTSDDPKDTDTCATKERVLDLEGAERANVCRVEVARWDEDEEWEMFLRTCDRLTCPPMPQPLAGRKLHV